MKNIKFRAWHKKRKEMYDVYGFNKLFVFKDTLDGVGCEGVPDNRDDVILLQYTGIKDKNGKEIYEDDLLLFDETNNDGSSKISNVWYSIYIGAWKIGEQLEFSDYMNGDNNILYEYKVVGNIHENQELPEGYNDVHYI